MLNKDGFKRKTYADLIEDMNEKAQELFGENINLSPRSPFGLILRLFAWFLSLTWEMVEKVYYSVSVTKSEGIQLDHLGSNKGLLREGETESTVMLTFQGTPGFTIPELKQYSTPNEVYFYLTEDVILDSEGKGSGQAVSVEKGLQTIVGANTITIQSEPLEGITSVTNLEASAGGRDREEDIEYRARIINSPSAGGKATTPAIISALSQTSGVRSYNVIINNKSESDIYGNPGKSIHAYVLGGERQAVAETLFDSVAGGIETVGQESVMVEDISGILHEVRFDYAALVNIQVSLSIKTNSSFTTDGQNQLKNSLIEFIGGTDTQGTFWPGLSMGQDVVFSQLFSKIYKVPGIEDVSLTIGPEGGPLTAGNIVIDPQEFAQTRTDLIGVTIT
ncbi:baseplate J/gp47 family protein [Peribacillus castrilensis]|uniref:baseplate J/gp47 family protein n=2 Tax=Peribacillus castrilensis TaxID=2897690 RepID=UPI003D2C4EAD